MSEQQTILDKVEQNDPPRTEVTPVDRQQLLPDWIRSDVPNVQTQDRIEQWATAPFVHIAQPKSQDYWAKLLQRFGSVKEGQAFLFMEGDQIIKLDPFRFSVALCRQFFVRMSGNGKEILETRKGDPGVKAFKERMVAMVIVYHDGKAIPATCEFRSTKCNAAHTAFNALEAAGREDWASKSPEHALTLQLPKPFQRYYVVAEPSPRPPRKADSLPFVLLIGHVKPTSVMEWKAMSDLVQNPTSVDLLCNVDKQYNRWVARYEEKLNESR